MVKTHSEWYYIIVIVIYLVLFLVIILILFTFTPIKELIHESFIVFSNFD